MEGNRNDHRQDEETKKQEQDTTEKTSSISELRKQVLGSFSYREEQEDRNETKNEKENLTNKAAATSSKKEEQVEEHPISSAEETPLQDEALPEESASRKTKGNNLDGFENRKKEDKMVKRIVRVVLMALIVCIIVAGFSFYSYFKAGLQPLNKNDKKLVQIEIPIGTSSKEIGNILEKDKVIKSGVVFTYYVKKNSITDFQGGFYQMSPNMTLSEITNLLKEGGTAEPEALATAKIRIPEGYSADQIATLIEKNTKFKKQEVIDLLQDQTFFNKLLAKYPELLTSASKATNVRYRLEGYLFPATYNYYKKNSLEKLIEQMVKASDDVMSSYYQKITEEKLTVHQVLTLASLVEKEGVTDSDRQKIAQVFFNRLAQAMPLQSDISVLYALDEHKEHLSDKDTQVDSPYNLYTNKGYGPGPFNNPSEKAINAVVNPDINVSDLYFLADVETGKVYFAKTYEEHLKLKKEHIDDKEK